MTQPDLSALAVAGAKLAVRVTPRAKRNAVDPGDPIRIWVTAPAVDGKATEAARKLLAKSLGIAPSRLKFVRGATARDKLFEIG